MIDNLDIYLTIAINSLSYFSCNTPLPENNITPSPATGLLQIMNYTYTILLIFKILSEIGIQCYNCDKNDFLSGQNTCGDLTIPTDLNTKTCPSLERFCMHFSATKTNSTLPSAKMGCAGEVESLLALTGLPIAGFCENVNGGCYSVANHLTEKYGLKNLELCCCTKHL